MLAPNFLKTFYSGKTLYQSKRRNLYMGGGRQDDQA